MCIKATRWSWAWTMPSKSDVINYDFLRSWWQSLAEKHEGARNVHGKNGRTHESVLPASDNPSLLWWEQQRDARARNRRLRRGEGKARFASFFFCYCFVFVPKHPSTSYFTAYDLRAELFHRNSHLSHVACRFLFEQFSMNFNKNMLLIGRFE